MASQHALLIVVCAASADITKFATDLESDAFPSDAADSVRNTCEALIAAANTSAASVS
jgi:hypothetical protein